MSERADAAVRDRFHERMRVLWATPYRGLPQWRGGQWFQERRGAAARDVLWAGPDLAAPGRVVLDPAALDGLVVVETAVSPDGRYVAYAVAHPGSEWFTWRIRDVASGSDLPGHSRPARYSGAFWSHDGGTLRYTGAPGDRAGPTALLSHRPGGAPEDDRVLFAAPDAMWSFDRIVDPGPGPLLVQVHDGCANRVFAGAPGAWREIGPAGVDLRLAGHHEGRALVLSDAGNGGRAVTAVAVRGDAGGTTPVADGPIDTAVVVGDHLVLVDDGRCGQRLRAVDLATGVACTASLPEFISVEEIQPARDPAAALLSVVSYATPAATYRVDFATGETVPVDAPDPAGHCARFRTVRRDVPAADGAVVAMYVVAARDAFDGAPQPVVLSVYGGFGSVVRPVFRWVWLAWLEAGGAVAFGGVRDGDDVVACARHLVAEGFSRPVVHGASAGGLSAAAGFLRRPATFGGLAVENAVLDLANYADLDPHGLWAAQFGSPVDPAASPVAAVRAGAVYPPVFVSAGDADELVNPQHSYRFAARLRDLAPATPLVLRVDPDAGHGRSATLEQICGARGDLLTFLATTLGLAS